MESRLAGIVIALVIAGAVLGYRFTQRDDRGEEVREQMMAFLRELPDYETHASLYNAWFDAHHETLFNKHYHIGSRRSRSYFEGDAYLEELCIAMGVDAAGAGYQSQAENIRALGDELFWGGD